MKSGDIRWSRRLSGTNNPVWGEIGIELEIREDPEFHE